MARRPFTPIPVHPTDPFDHHDLSDEMTGVAPSEVGSRWDRVRAFDRRAVTAGLFLSAWCSVLLLLPIHVPLGLVVVWSLTCMAGVAWWCNQMGRYWDLKWQGHAASKTQHRWSIVASAALGLLLSAPVALDSSLMTDLHLQSFSWLVMSTCVFICATVPLRTWPLHALLAAANLPLVWVWATRGGSLHGHFFHLLLGGAWTLCLCLHQRALHFARRSWNFSRERASIVDALAQRNRMLEAAHRSKSRILTTASHEIRQPVHALGLLIERLRLEPEARHLRSQVEEISLIVQSLSHSLGMLLDISRLDEGIVTVRPSKFRVRALFDRIGAEFEVSALDKGLRLVVDPGVNPWIESDYSLLYSIVSNLVSNAVRYTDAGQVRVRCEVEGDQVFLEVADTGPGIPESHRDSIFQEYVRLHQEHQTTQGFGLGLAIVRRTADLLGVHIGLESTVGQGSRFSVGLPAVAGDPQAEPVVTPGVASALAVGRGLVGLRGLVIDNDPVVLRGMDAMLRSWGCLPVLATSFDDLEATLRHMSREDLDFVVADYHLGAGKRNGVDAIERVRALCGRSLPASLLTGDIEVRSLAGGTEHEILVLHKPVLPAKLRDMVELMAGRARERAVPPGG